ncbi:MAG: KEOPS complex subunit Cgi121 [archaeon]
MVLNFKKIYIKAFLSFEDDYSSFLNRYKNVLLVDNAQVGGEKHILQAFLHAKKAFKEKNNFAKKFPLEFLVRLCGERQINKAIEKSSKENKKIFICWGKNCDKIWNLFKKQFKINELHFENKEDELDFLHRTATFWLRP